MKRKAIAMICLGMLGATFAVGLGLGPAGQAAAASSPDPVRFGMDSASMAAQANAGVAADYGTFWIGPWTLKSGWGGPDAEFSKMRAQGVTPAVHFYYWGDDISQSCVENGCWSSLHNTQKDRTQWQALAQQLVDHMNSQMGGKPVTVFVETEFNKGNVGAWEPLDGYLADKAAFLKAGYPNAEVVMPLGNWNSGAWGTFDRFAAKSDAIGVQGMRASTKDSPTTYANLYDAVLKGAQTAHNLFGKPVFIDDLALSSYPEPQYTDLQDQGIRAFFTGMPALQDAGVMALIYRSWSDSPGMSTANYYGEAERHWGLANANSQGGAWKPAASTWVEGVKQARSAATAAANQAPTARLSAVVDGLTAAVDGTASSDPEGQALTYAWAFGDGASATGATASHAYAQGGTYTVALTVSDGIATHSASAQVSVARPNRAPAATFTVTMRDLAATFDGRGSSDPDGDALTHTWSFGDGTGSTGAQTNHTYAKAGTYTATLTVSDGTAASATPRTVTATSPAPAATSYTPSFRLGNVNEWWVDVGVSPAASKVEVKVGSGAWTSLPATDWGTWAKSVHVVKGSAVTFRATDAAGHVATSNTITWMGGTTGTGTTGSGTPAPTSTSSQPAATQAPAFTASLKPKGTANNWWVEAVVSSNQPLAKVEARTNGGAWTQLPHTDWGNYAKSYNVPDYAKVEFRATSTSGATVVSQPYTWI